MWRSMLILLAACSASGDRPTHTPSPNAPSPAPTPSPAPATTASAAPQPQPPEPEWHLPGDTPAPEGFVDVGFDFERPTQKATCHGLTIEHLNDDPNKFEPRVKVTDQTGRVVYAARGRAYNLGGGDGEFRMSLVVDRCGDLTGDGVPELMMTERTMGAHCCYTHYVVSLTQPQKQLLMWEKGDAGHGMLPVKWKDGKAWQILSMHLVNPPFDGRKEDDPVIAGYAGIPSYPIVFELVGGTYQKRTFQFVKDLSRMREEHRELCKKVKDGCGDTELYEWGLALIIGDWNEEKKSIADDFMRKALERHATTMRSRLRTELGP